MSKRLKALLAAAALLLTPVSALAAEPVYGAELQGFEYPFPVQRFEFVSQRQSLQMAYMDIAPTGQPNGRTAVLLHGKNFCGATWEGSARALQQAGYRVLMIDQIGFCKSSKPQQYQFSLQQLAFNTQALIAKLGLSRVTLIGHSMGGMLAMRYALAYPQQLDALVLVNPIGLEDWLAAGVPYVGIDQLYQKERKTSFDSIKQYQLKTYYDGHWKPEYDRWVQMLAGMVRGDGGDAVAWNQALTSDMVLTQPVIHQAAQIRVPTLLLIGQRDNTAIGKDAAPADVAARLGDYPRLGRELAQRLPNAKLVAFDDLGHAPQMQDPARFNAALVQGLQAR